jgi:hypothetical protein
VDGIVGADSYELHNPAYVAAIIWHYYKYTGDKDFLKKYFPVIEEVFRFYANISNKNEDGRFDIFHEKGRGQDEASSTAGDLMNLLCSSYSAQYSAQNYVEAAKIVSIYDQSLFERANDIVSAGYERRTLLNDEGYYVTYEGDNRPKHSQKHPVQLNPIAFVPMPEEVNNDPAVKTAWKNRYDLTYKALKPKTRGWTFGEFALASCRLGSAVDLEKDISTIQLCRGADPRWIQFYESSFWPGWHLNKSYYFPMMGLFMQTFTDAVLQDWEGYINYFNCILPQWNQEPLRFKGLQSLNGVVSNGWYHNGDFEIEIIPGKSNSTKIKISEGNRPVVAEGTADGNVEFKTNELVTLNFDGQNPIVLKSVKH